MYISEVRGGLLPYRDGFNINAMEINALYSVRYIGPFLVNMREAKQKTKSNRKHHTSTWPNIAWDSLNLYSSGRAIRYFASPMPLLDTSTTRGAAC